jgi:hypothetical protein
MRETVAWRDEIYLGGFANTCHATRRRRWSLIVPGGLPVTQRVDGNALTVLHTVVSDWDRMINFQLEQAGSSIASCRDSRTTSPTMTWRQSS